MAAAESHWMCYGRLGSVLGVKIAVLIGLVSCVRSPRSLVSIDMRCVFWRMGLPPDGDGCG
jgi:hypothetical protein